MEYDPKAQKVHGDKVGGDKIVGGDIVESSGIAIGRGSQAIVIGGSAVKGGKLVEPQAFQFDDLVTALDQIEIPQEEKENLGSELVRLRQEVELGDQGNVEVATDTLILVSDVAPDLRQPTWQWLSEDDSASMPIKIVARKLLT